MATVKWLSYEFTVYEKDGGRWHDVPGVYIFSGIGRNNLWNAFYIGKCESFSDRLPTHERWYEARQIGATHVHALGVSQEATRASIEQALIAAYQPPLNTQHR